MQEITYSMIETLGLLIGVDDANRVFDLSEGTPAYEITGSNIDELIFRIISWLDSEEITTVEDFEGDRKQDYLLLKDLVDQSPANQQPPTNEVTS